MAGTGITGMIGALDMQQARGGMGVSMYTIINELKTGAGVNTNAITTAKLNALAVTAAKIGTSAIATAKLAALAVITAKIAAGAVTTAKIAAGAVGLGSGTDGATTGDVNAIYQTVTTVTANITVTVAHGLSRTPVGVIAVKQDKSASIYATGTWDTTNIFIKASAATVALTLMVF